MRLFTSGVDEMAADSTFKGYGPEQGYPFLREKIARYDFQARGADIRANEIFISDGLKMRHRKHPGNLFHGRCNRHSDPVYPV